MKKLFCSMLSVLMLMTCTAFSASASALNSVDDFVTTIPTMSVDSMETANYHDILADVDTYVRTLDTVSDGETEISRTEIALALEKELFGTVQTYSYIYSDSVALANVLAAYDGMSATDIAVVIAQGSLAKDDAENRTYSDSYRHSTWNFRATKLLSASSVRIYTINYEWANQLVGIWQDYYDERYEYYFDLYYISIILGALNVSTIMMMAEADADDYICEYKSELQATCRNSYSTFCAIFTNDNIMDWWNNKIGRDYGTNYSSYTPEQMFTSAYNNNELILDADTVASSDYWYMWAYTNWWYTGA